MHREQLVLKLGEGPWTSIAFCLVSSMARAGRRMVGFCASFAVRARSVASSQP